MKRKMVWAGLIFIALLLAGCRTKEQLVMEKDNGSTVSMRIGEKLLVQLEGNPTTGYEWLFSAFNEKYLRLQGEPEYQRESNLIGAGGRYTFIFARWKPAAQRLRCNTCAPSNRTRSRSAPFRWMWLSGRGVWGGIHIPPKVHDLNDAFGHVPTRESVGRLSKAAKNLYF